mmetsp:Transcript_16766/g.35384  ORF Transcript_16766/g.35384 Transcript_16766/m.35384 type:complete len:114 (-) Transcript_16766:1327-1668(-)
MSAPHSQVPQVDFDRQSKPVPNQRSVVLASIALPSDSLERWTKRRIVAHYLSLRVASACLTPPSRHAGITGGHCPQPWKGAMLHGNPTSNAHDAVDEGKAMPCGDADVLRRTI